MTNENTIERNHCDFKITFRNYVLEAMDEASVDYEMKKVQDSDLPELFRCLDALAEKLWLRSVGLQA